MPNNNLQVLNIETKKGGNNSLVDFAIDSPKIGNELNGKCRIAGWVLGKAVSAIAIEAVNDLNQVIEKIPVDKMRPGVAKKHPSVPGAEKSGFDRTLDSDKFGTNQKLALQAVLENGERAKLGTIYCQAKTKHQFISRDRYKTRLTIAEQFIAGDGIEIGALHSPLKVPSSAKVKYVDRMNIKDLREQYPDLRNKELVEVNIIDNGELLENIANSSQDFVIANHFLEHCQNPILAIKNMLRVLKKDGVVYLAIPDKRFTFDKDRPTTSIAHLLKDYQDSPQWSKKQHFEEWVQYVTQIKNPVKAKARVNHLMEIDYSIHYHVWTQTQIMELLCNLQSKLDFPFEVKLLIQNNNEIVVVMSKNK